MRSMVKSRNFQNEELDTHLGSQLEAEVAEKDGKAHVMHHVCQRLPNALPAAATAQRQAL